MDFNQVRTVAVGGYNKADVEEYVKHSNDRYTNLLENSNSQIAFYSKSIEDLETALQILNMQNKDYQDEIAKLRFTIELEYKKITEIDKQLTVTHISTDKEDLHNAKRRADFIMSTAHDESAVILSEVKRKAALVMRKLRSSEEQATVRAEKIANSIIEKAKIEASRIIKEASDNAKEIMLINSSDGFVRNEEIESDIQAKPYKLSETDSIFIELEDQTSFNVLPMEKEQQSLNFGSAMKDVSQSLDELEQALSEIQL